MSKHSVEIENVRQNTTTEVSISVLRVVLEFCAACLYMGIIYIASSRPTVVPVHFPGIPVDKIVHFIVFGGLSYTLSWPFFRTLRRPFWAVWCAVVCAGLFGIFDEWHQAHVPGRFSDVYDIYADMVGAVLGGSLWMWRHSKTTDSTILTR